MFRFTSDDAPDLPDEVLTGALFAGVPPAGRRAFLSQLTHLSASPGTTLYAQGESGDTLWIVLVGEITVRRALDDGRIVELDRAGPGDVFGVVALLSPAPRSGSAVAGAVSVLLGLLRDSGVEIRTSEEAEEIVVVNGKVSGVRISSGFTAAMISLRKMMLAAPPGPMTAISAVGQAKTKSARRWCEHMAMYPPP